MHIPLKTPEGDLRQCRAISSKASLNQSLPAITSRWPAQGVISQIMDKLSVDMRKAILGLAAALGILGVAEVHAQPRPGAHEVSGAGSFFRPIGSGSGAFNVDGTYGYSLADPAIQVGFRQSFNLNHNDDSPDVWNAVTAPYMNYHFMGSESFVPYAGAFVGAVWNDDDITGTVGPQVGIKSYLTDSAFVMANYRYEWFFEEIGDVNDRQDANHAVTLGFGYQWGGARS